MSIIVLHDTMDRSPTHVSQSAYVTTRFPLTSGETQLPCTRNQQVSLTSTDGGSGITSNATEIPYAPTTGLESRTPTIASETHSSLVHLRMNSLEEENRWLRQQLRSVGAVMQSVIIPNKKLLGRVVGNEDALFLLSEIVGRGIVTLRVLDDNLVAPDGWVAFADLLRAGLIDQFGGVVSATDDGIDLIEELENFGPGSLESDVGDSTMVGQSTETE